MVSAAPSYEIERPSQAGTDAAPRYVGLATRVIAMTLDAALINLVAIIVGLGAALILSLLHRPKDLRAVLAAIGGAAYVVWTIGYFVAFWSTTGQTPGGRVIQIRVMGSNGRPVKLRRALVRCVGLFLAALPLFAGYVTILFDARRRGFHDRLAGTVVVEAPQMSVAAARRARARAARNGSRTPGAVD